jgi:hypothetical protein
MDPGSTLVTHLRLVKLWHQALPMHSSLTSLPSSGSSLSLPYTPSRLSMKARLNGSPSPPPSQWYMCSLRLTPPAFSEKRPTSTRFCPPPASVRCGLRS